MDQILFERFNNRDNVRFKIDKTGKFELSRGVDYASIKLDANEVDKLVEFLKNRNLRGCGPMNVEIKDCPVEVANDIWNAAIEEAAKIAKDWSICEEIRKLKK